MRSRMSTSMEACRGSLLVIELDEKSPNLLIFGDREQKLGVQFGVVLGQGLMAIVIDELHYRQEGKRLREAVPPVSVVNLYKLVVPPFPAEGARSHMRTRRQ